MLWCSVSLFSRHDNDDLSDTGNFYHGCPIAPDAPLNGIMSLQVHLSMSIAKRYGMPGLQTKIRLMSKASGNERDFKKFIKRLCKFQAKGVLLDIRMYEEWANSKNISSFKSWLKSLKPIHRDQLISSSLAVTDAANEAFLRDNLEKWALPSSE